MALSLPPRRSGPATDRTLAFALALAVVGGLFLVLLSGCGDVKVALSDDCGTDSDCGNGQFCIDNECTTGCRADDDCRSRGLGFYCVDDECTNRDATAPLLLVLTVGGALRVEEPEEAVVADVGEQTAAFVLDAGESVYLGDGEVVWAWRVAEAPADATPTLSGDAGPQVTLTTPRVFADTPVRLELTASYMEGSETVTLALTIRNSVNEPPDVTATGPTAPVSAGESVTLEASAADPNGEGVATPFTWTQPQGTAVTLEDATGDGAGDGSWARVRFTVPPVVADETLTFRVAARDTHDPSAEGSADVTVDVLASASECTSDVQCPVTAACRVGRCGDDGRCAVDVAVDGAPCDDADACTSGDECLEGACVGAARDCDDDDPCTVDSCDAGTGACSNTPITSCCAVDADCDDGDLCTDDSCGATNRCVHTPVAACCRDDGDCDDEEPCTSDHCDTATGSCGHSPVTGCCRSAADCVDDDPCTENVCNEDTGVCAFPAAPGCCESDADCDDGDVCTNDACDTGTGDCSHETVTGCCRRNADCDDGDVCTRDICDAESGECVRSEIAGCCRSAADCDDDDPCTADTCDAATGTCGHEEIAACCRTAAECDDGLVCTTDSCDVTSGECRHTAVPDCCRTVADCDDDDVCTTDTCVTATGACSYQDVPGCCRTAADCADDDPCTDDVCNVATGACSHPALPGCCGDDADCDDGDVCTTDTCVTATGDCRHDDVAGCCRSGADCADGDVCTRDECDEATGVCSNPDVAGCCRSAADCADDDPCTADTCDRATGVCTNAEIGACCRANADCDDQDPCTSDTCDGNTNTCVHADVPGCCRGHADCDDGRPCTLDRCVQNVCTAPLLPLGTACEEAGRIAPHDALCDGAGECVPFERDVWPPEPLFGSSESHYAFRLYDVWRRANDATTWAVGREWYYLFRMTAPPINEERGSILAIEGGAFVDRPFISGRAGAYRGIHHELAVGPAGIAASGRDGWVDVVNDLQLSSSVYGTAEDVWGGPASILCCPDAWLLFPRLAPPVRLYRDSFGGWSWTSLFYSPTVRPLAGAVWGFAYDPIPGDGTLDLQIRDLSIFLDEGNFRSVRYAERLDPDFGFRYDPPGCSPDSGPCATAGVWRDAHGVREGGQSIVWGVGQHGTIQAWNPRFDGWQALAPDTEGLAGVPLDAIDWEGVAVVSRYAFLVGTTDACPHRACLEGADSQRSIVLLVLARDSREAVGLAVLDSYGCNNTTGGRFLPCETHPLESLAVGDLWVDTKDGALEVQVVGTWPEFVDGAVQDTRASLYVVRLTP